MDTVILGLGTNLGDRLLQLRNALCAIKKIPDFCVEKISPVYISDALLPDDAPNEWVTPYLNLALRCKTTLSPYDLLHRIKKIELTLGRKPEKRWGPRIIDIDILAWDALIQYDNKLHIPHESLHERPFALWPLADVAPFWIYPLPGIYQGKTAAEIANQWGSRFTGLAPFRTKQIAQRIDTAVWVGIINVTPNSFSGDGMSDLSENTIIPYAEQLVNSGAEIIDIGAEATNPTASPIDAKTEWLRLEPVLKNLLREKNNLFIPPKISVDTRHANTAEKALALGVDWINDVSGLDTVAMRDVIKNHHSRIVIMHHLAIPQDKTIFLPWNENVTARVLEWGKRRIEKIEKHGISREKIIFDVGIGFGKTAEQSLQLIQDIHAFHSLNVPLLVGHSRKVFMGLFTEKPFSERDVETASIATYLNQQGVNYIRVHNVDACARASRVAATVWNEPNTITQSSVCESEIAEE